jgi:hypothetical protein
MYATENKQLYGVRYGIIAQKIAATQRAIPA